MVVCYENHIQEIQRKCPGCYPKDGQQVTFWCVWGDVSGVGWGWGLNSINRETWNNVILHRKWYQIGHGLPIQKRTVKEEDEALIIMHFFFFLRCLGVRGTCCCVQDHLRIWVFIKKEVLVLCWTVHRASCMWRSLWWGCLQIETEAECRWSACVQGGGAGDFPWLVSDAILFKELTVAMWAAVGHVNVAVTFCSSEIPYTSQSRTMLAVKVLPCWRSKWLFECGDANPVRPTAFRPEVKELGSLGLRETKGWVLLLYDGSSVSIL